MKLNKYILTFLICVVGLCLCFSPVSGKVIDYGYSQTYDATSSTQPFGEEINVKFWITAVDSDIQDISTTFSESGAFIDPGSFSYSLDSPYQQSVPFDIRRTDKTYSIAKLKRGEKVTLIFNAYPKTITDKNLNIGAVAIGYTPVLENNTKGKPIVEEKYQIISDMKNSAWFQFEQLQNTYETEKQNQANVPYLNQALIGITAVAVIIALIFLFFWWKTKSQLNKEIKRIKEEMKINLIQIRDELRLASESDIPRILSIVDEFLISDKMRSIETKDTPKQEPKDPKKDGPKNNTGGF
jgi:hypothetical protein